MEMEPQADLSRAFDTVDADLSVALRRVRVACGKKGPGTQHRQVQRRSAAEFAYIHVAAENPGWPGEELAVLGPGNAHHAAKRAQRYQGRHKRPADCLLE